MHILLSKSFAIAGAAILCLPFATPRAEENHAAVRDGTIGYVLSDVRWAIYQTADGKSECPTGLNEGPREQFRALFPDGGARRTVLETQLAREGAVWSPASSDMREPIAFKEAEGGVALGLNLDGKVGARDLVSPDGERGIDNELWRVLGCVAGHRGPSGDQFHFINEYNHKHNNNRYLIEISGVDNLLNDEHVVVTTYRGQDSLLSDATGERYIPGGTQRTDMKWGKDFVRRFNAKIVNGVLESDATDAFFPMSMGFDHVGAQYIRSLRFRLKLNGRGAEGFMGGYVDVEQFYRNSIQGNSTHHLSYGQQSAISIHRALLRRADAFPDAGTGVNTAISGALKVQFTQAFIVHPSSLDVVGAALRPSETKLALK